MVNQGYSILGQLIKSPDVTDGILGYTRFQYLNTTGFPVTSITLPTSFQSGTILVVERQFCESGYHYIEDAVNNRIIITSKTILKYDLIPKGARCFVLYIPC